MRETKFRGRKINSDKWVVGNLGYTKTGGGNAGILVDGKLHIVDSETVSQFTGLYDKNRKEIYEKDVAHMVGVIPGFEMDYVGIVKFIDGSYVLENLAGNDGWLLFQEGAEVEVLGDVHKTPGLLAGVNK
ncbi:hypothetical protein HB667_26975 [Bacillus cereus]|uniref:YopX family protein n=1 Tax=Bacillus cereus group TaxID=86661 RepID=UPI0014446F9B|nr:YopX family protein [Bacillus cereus]NKW77459.1 hypothetical protein [Bacillus cereus]NKX14785.1 hypothetical protein [Bacillus cereus]HDR8003398.1 hypothetical protein [Bacillus cereus]HDR8014944.1 hypothetical protein [Bacillus cereus]